MLHITNLIKAHIGIEFNSYINIECHSVKGKDVVVIEVKSSPEPAFLHMSDNDEEFYVRSGPSSVSLTISKAIKYINDKKNKNKSQKS
jgi:predicted HTH transcriptional regulator